MAAPRLLFRAVTLLAMAMTLLGTPAARASTPVYMFTDAPCQQGIPFGANGQCKPVIANGSPQMSNTDIPMYITYVVNNIPTSLAVGDVTVKMKFALSCHNPGKDNGTSARFYQMSAAVKQLQPCARDGLVPAAGSASWGAAYSNIVFAGATASSKASYVFNYPDVGRIELLAIDDHGRLGTSNPFVSRPKRIVLLPLAANKATTPADVSNGAAFVAGADFQLTVQAMTGGTVPVTARNFGQESPPAVVSIAAAVATDGMGASFLEMLQENGATAVALRGSLGGFTLGQAQGLFAYDDVGIISLQLKLDGDDYLGSGNVGIDPSVNFGRFYPDHFITTPVAPMPCNTQVPCAAGINGIAYSQQPFEVQVTAFNKLGGITKNYRGVFARTVALTAFASAKGGAQNPPTATPGQLTVAAIPAQSFPRGLDASSPTGYDPNTKYGIAVAKPAYTFPIAYPGSTTGANAWVAPTNVFLRAAEVGGDGVTSKSAGGIEGGLVILLGRMTVANAYGSELVPLPLRLQAQYYSAVHGWVPSLFDSVSSLNAASDLAYSNCSNVGYCSGKPVTLPSGVVTLASGAATIKLDAPRIAGRADVSVKNPVWLPSALGRATFGSYRAPFIFLREIH